MLDKKSTIKYLPAKTLYLLAIILLPLYAQAGWGDALLKQVVKDVATETVKQEATKAIVNQFNKADPNYEGLKQPHKPNPNLPRSA